MDFFPKSDKLEHVCYDIRGPVHKEAMRLEEEAVAAIRGVFTAPPTVRVSPP